MTKVKATRLVFLYVNGLNQHNSTWRSAKLIKGLLRSRFQGTYLVVRGWQVRTSNPIRSHFCWHTPRQD